MKIDSIQAGDRLFDVRREKMGNTTMSRTAVYPVYIVSIDHTKNTAMVRWNGNPPTKYYSRALQRLVRTPPKGTPARDRIDRERALARSATPKEAV